MAIPTVRKPKLPKDLAFPIGAERLSEAIGDLPQAAEMTITFIAPNHFRPATWRFTNRPYDVLEFQYHRQPRGISTPRIWSEHGPPGTTPWRIWVWAVPRNALTQIKALLTEGLLKTARPWLFAQGATTQQEGSSRLVLRYDPSEMQMTASVEDKLLPKSAKQ